MSKLLTKTVAPKEAAEIMGVSRATVWRLLQRRVLSRIKISKQCVRIPLIEIENYLHRNLIKSVIPA